MAGSCGTSHEKICSTEITTKADWFYIPLCWDVKNQYISRSDLF